MSVATMGNKAGGIGDLVISQQLPNDGGQLLTCNISIDGLLLFAARDVSKAVDVRADSWGPSPAMISFSSRKDSP